MTGYTGYPRIMVSRIIAAIRMTINERRPASSRPVADVAVLRGNEVSRPALRLIACRERTVVTGNTVSSNSRMIPGATYKCRSGMTEMTI